MTIPLAMAPLLSAVLGALVGGLIVTIAFSFVILGVTRFEDLRRVGRRGAATAYVTLGVVGALAATGTVVYGLILVTSK
jgi:Na+/H+-dicarboxylate symporter